MVVLIGLVAKLESRLPFDAKHCEYAISTGEVELVAKPPSDAKFFEYLICSGGGSLVLLVDACVHVRRVLRAVLTWLLVLVSTVEAALL